jgi:hypothetical protein
MLSVTWAVGIHLSDERKLFRPKISKNQKSVTPVATGGGWVGQRPKKDQGRFILSIFFCAVKGGEAQALADLGLPAKAKETPTRSQPKCQKIVRPGPNPVAWIRLTKSVS